jgi:tetratricopeptide (TPR) repeat protein
VAGDEAADDDFAFARNLFRDAGDWDTAARKFAEFILDYPTDANLPEARLMLARSYSRSDRRCEEAVRAYAAFFEHHPQHLSVSEARRERADCLAQLGQFRQAAVALEEVQTLFSASTFAPDVLLKAASNYRRADDFVSAARVYDRVIGEYSTLEAAHNARYHLAQLRFAQGDWSAALALLEQIDAASPKSSQARDALLLSERILLILGRSTEADHAMARLLKRFASSAHADSALVDFARFHFAQARYGEAVVAYEKAAGRKSRPPGWMNHVQLGLADALRESGEFDRAVEMYGKVISRPEVGAATLGLAKLGLATTNSRTGRVREAVPMFLYLIQRNGNATAATSSPTSRLIWAMAVRELAALYRQQGDYTRSSVWYDEYLSEADRQGPAFAESQQQQEWVRLQMAKLYDSAGQSGRAIELFESLQNASAQLQPEVQRSLAAAFETAGETGRALHEYRVFLERFPDHNHARRVRERIELLSEFTIRDRDGLDSALHQITIDDINGRSRRALMFDLALTLRHHQDYGNAARTFETYVASYPDDPDATQAQYMLAECLLRLSRKREIEGENALADSLRLLGLEEHRILATKGSPFSRRAQLRLVEVGALGAPDSTRLRVLEAGLTSFLSDSLSAQIAADAVAVETRVQALLLLGDTRRQLAAVDTAILPTALTAYEQLMELAPEPEFAVRARFGRALCFSGLGREGVVDSLQALLNQHAGRALVPEILVELGYALVAADQPRRAVSRFRELLAAYPAYPRRRMVLEELAAINFQLGEYRLAIGQYQKLVDSEPQPERVFNLRRRLAMAYRAAGHSVEALDLYASMLRWEPNAPGADSLAFNRGALLLELGRLEDAVDAFSNLQRDYPSSGLVVPAQIESADLLFELGRYDQAHGIYTKLPKEAALPRLVGRTVVALYRLNRLEEGRKLSKGVDDAVWKVLVQLEEGRLYLRDGEHERAQKLFAQVEKKSRDKPLELGNFSERDADLANMATSPSAAAGYYLATSKWRQNEKDPSEEGLVLALEAQRRFLADYVDSPHAVDIRLRVGTFNYAFKNYLMAAADFRRVLETPSAPRTKKQDAVWMLLNCYLKAYEWADAHDIAARLLKEFPDHPKTKDTQLEIGNVLIEQGQHAKSIEHFKEVLSWAAGNEAANARFHIGKALQNMGEWSKAVEAYYRVRYEGADAFSGWITTADYERAHCHEKMRQNATAKNIYNEIIQREGSDSDFGKDARKQLERLERLEQ